METKEAYNEWAQQYDTNQNKTRDLEGQVLRSVLGKFTFESVLEVGCGTGKNTGWLVQNAKQIIAVDFSDEMLAKAKIKLASEKVIFKQADITYPWSFIDQTFDLVVFSLVLEHIENLQNIFTRVAAILNKGGYCYVGELHPFKQYTGSKARFETEAGVQVVNCYTHNISDFIQSANAAGLELEVLEEHFDDNNRTTIPRILTLVFSKI